MSTLFTLVHLAALVCFIVFLVKMIKLKKSVEDHSQAKKFMLISIAVWFVSLIVVGVTTPTNEEEKKEVAESAVATTDEVVEATEEESNNESGIILEAGVPGEYGQDLVLNAGTEFEDKTIGYFVPSGKYRVTNIGDHQTQVNVYKNEKNVVDGWEEWADCNVELLAVGGTTEMTVDEGYFFNIDPPAVIRIEKID